MRDPGCGDGCLEVKCGYTSEISVLNRCKPARLNFRREETASCSEMVLLPDFAGGVAAIVLPLRVVANWARVR